MASTTSKDGTPIGYETHGSGPLLICVAGATQYRAVDPDGTPALANLLASDFTVLIYDRRGRGESGDTAPYGVEREIEDIAALIAENGGTARLFGMSSGAVLALEAAASSARRSKAWCSTSRLSIRRKAPRSISAITPKWRHWVPRARPRR